MATYNGARFLEEQLASLAAQERLPIELVVCDDGSTDATLEILARFAERAPFAVHVNENHPRLGFRANFMKCAGLCAGDIVSFCDQDDIWESGKLARVAAVFDDPAVMLVSHGALLIDERGTAIGEMPGSDPGTDLFQNDPWPLRYGFSMSFRRHLLDYAHLWSGSVSHFIAAQQMGHDRWIVLVAAALGKVVVLPDRLVRYRQHQANVYGAPRRGASKFRPPRLAEMRRERTDLQLKARAAENRVDMLSAIGERRVAGGAGDLDTMLARYSALARRLQLREALHQSPRLLERVSVLGRLLAERAYGRGDGWRFTAKALAKDLLVIVPLGGDRA